MEACDGSSVFAFLAGLAKKEPIVRFLVVVGILKDSYLGYCLLFMVFSNINLKRDPDDITAVLGLVLHFLVACLQPCEISEGLNINVLMRDSIQVRYYDSM